MPRFAVPKGRGCCPPRPSWPDAEERGWEVLGCPPTHFGISPLAKLLSRCPVLAHGLRDGPGMCVLPRVALGRGRRLCLSLGPISKAVSCGFLQRDVCGKGMASCGTPSTSTRKCQVDALCACRPISESAPLSRFSLFQLGDHHWTPSFRILCLLKEVGLLAWLGSWPTEPFKSHMAATSASSWHVGPLPEMGLLWGGQHCGGTLLGIPPFARAWPGRAAGGHSPASPWAGTTPHGCRPCPGWCRPTAVPGLAQPLPRGWGKLTWRMAAGAFSCPELLLLCRH